MYIKGKEGERDFWVGEKGKKTREKRGRRRKGRKKKGREGKGEREKRKGVRKRIRRRGSLGLNGYPGTRDT